jgi:nucleoside-diphosphate-sugar epimerase
VRIYDLLDGLDIMDVSSLEDRMAGANVVVHLAALPTPRPECSFDEYFDQNCVGTNNVLRAATAAGVGRYVHASSIAVHGVEDGFPPVKEFGWSAPYLAQRSLPEQSAASASEVAYAASKAAAEQIVANYAFVGSTSARILRLGPVEVVHQGWTVSMAEVVEAFVAAIVDPTDARLTVRTVVRSTEPSSLVEPLSGAGTT